MLSVWTKTLILIRYQLERIHTKRLIISAPEPVARL